MQKLKDKNYYHSLTDCTILPKKARMNLAVRSPSICPPGPIILATPLLRHLARPRDAENTEEKKVRKKNSFDLNEL